jgi:hypothetical protein
MYGVDAEVAACDNNMTGVLMATWNALQCLLVSTAAAAAAAAAAASSPPIVHRQ